MTPPFERFVKREWSGTLLTLDPGHTTGWALWVRKEHETPKLVSSGQWNSYPMSKVVDTLDFFAACKEANHVVLEEYRVYNWKTEQHANSDVFTLRLIGALEYYFGIKGIPVTFQGAGLAKGFCTDEKLEDWGFWQTGQRHARDAIRHGAYFWCSKEKR